ncbi:MAG: hypothetical protein ACYDD1_04970, partial [Caulobacteraceae bacterium]
MADPLTPVLGLSLPVVGGDDDTWGTTINDDLTLIDTAMGTKLAATNGAATGLTLTQAAAPAVNAAGYLGSPINGQNVDYQLEMTDLGLTVFHNSTTSHTYTIPEFATVAWPLGISRTLMPAARARLTISA